LASAALTNKRELPPRMLCTRLLSPPVMSQPPAAVDLRCGGKCIVCTRRVESRSLGNLCQYCWNKITGIANEARRLERDNVFRFE
jgi:hypothetical protein